MFGSMATMSLAKSRCLGQIDDDSKHELSYVWITYLKLISMPVQFYQKNFDF